MTEVAQPKTTFRGFLFADLRGYSDYVEAHGDHGGVELLDRYRQLVRATISRFDGAEIRTEGDSFYVVFPSASSAVSCAMVLVSQAGREEPPIRVGVGVHAGEAADTGEGPVGSAVNIAARVCARAGAGEVLATETVRAVTRTVLPYRYAPRGSPTLKGIAEPIALYSVLEPGARVTVIRPSLLRRVPAWVVAVVGTIAVVFGAVAAFAFIPRAAAPTGPATPAPTIAAIASATATGALSSSSPIATPALAQGEADLLDRFTGLTEGQRSGCRSATAEERATAAAVSVTCEFPPGDAAATLRLDLFGQPSEMLTAFGGIVTAHGGPAGDCATAPSAYGPWNLGRFSQGHVICYPSGGDSYIVWSYEGGDGAGIMGTAVRHDVLWQQLFAWWQDFHRLITH